jgi:hypothetical protein
MWLATLLSCTTPITPPPAHTFAQDWVLLYYIPYDNDLGPHADPVLEQLRAATAGSTVEVAALVDRPGPGGLTLTTFADGLGRPYPDPTNDSSADPETLRDFLGQAASLYEARRYAVMILDHGGGLMEAARDEHPQPGWLDVRDISEAVSAFRAEEAGEVELLFMQVCAKAALAPLLALQPAARTTLAAQTLLGAPNDYYVPAIQHLAANPTADGPALAASIAQGSMYVSYTCTDNAALSHFAEHAAPAIAAGGEATAESLADARFLYGGEEYVDLGVLLGAVNTPESVALAGWLQDTVSCGYLRAASPRPELLARGPDPTLLTGISTHLPGGRRSVVDDAVAGWSAFIDRATPEP